MQPTHLKKITLATTLICLMSACSTDQSLLSSKVDYRSGSDNLNKNTLEIPPDLTTISTNNTYNLAATATATQTAQAPRVQNSQAVLPQYGNARIVVQDGIRYIEAQLPPEKAWEDIKDFWLGNGFILTTENPNSGVMETDWLQNRADLPSDFMTNLLRKAADQFVSTDTIDKYRSRIERGTLPGTVNIYVTHRGMTEVYKEGQANTQQWNGTVWTPSEPKPELEAEIMAMMLQSLGVKKELAQTEAKQAEKLPARASLNNSGQAIELTDSFDRAWRRVGLALDRIGYNVQDRNRSSGIYTVQRAATDIDKEAENNYFSSLAFWKKSNAKDGEKPTNAQTFDVKLSEQNGKSVLTISSKEGAIDSGLQKKMLNDLLIQLK
jgi:outer membrane protein assembly factor BamC